MKVIGLISAILFIWFAASAGGGISLHSFIVTAMLASWFAMAQILGGGECGTGGGGGGTGAPPSVLSVTPSSGPTTGGTAVTINGSNFGLGATVTFGGVAASNVVVLNTGTITCTTPPGAAGPVLVTVTVAGQAGSLPNGYTYVAVPTVTSVTPNSGPIAGGTNVTIAGTNFAAGATVTFGGTAATNVVVVNANTITATTPARAYGVVTVAVTVAGQTGSLANAYTYVAPIYGGVGAQGATSVTAQVGTTATLDTGDILDQLQTTPETSGPSSPLLGPFSPATQSIYLLLVGGSHTSFQDGNGFAFPMNAPVTVTVPGRGTMYLYQSANLYFFPFSIRIMN